MYIKLILVSIAIAILNDVDCKRTKSKKLSETEESTPQPSVLTYSNFGFNDVGSYDGFVPSSPDYTSFVHGSKQESSTRLYAPAFPSTLDSTGFDANYGSAADGQSPQNPGEELQASMSKYEPVSLNFFTSPSFDGNNPYNYKANPETTYDQNEGEKNSPIYGAKLSTKFRSKPFSEFKSSENNKSTDGNPLNINTDAYRMQDSYISPDNKQFYGDLNNNNYPSFYKFTTTTILPPEYDHMLQSPVTASGIKFPKVIDFTNLNPYNQNGFNANGYPGTDFYSGLSNTYENINNNGNMNQIPNDVNKNTKTAPASSKYKTYFKDDQMQSEKEVMKFNYAANQEFSQNYFNNKNKLKGKFTLNNNKINKKPWDYNSKAEEVKKSKSPLRYEYSTNHSHTNFQYDYPSKRPFNSSIDELAPASSNLDFYNYQHPDIDFGNSPLFPTFKNPLGDFDTNDFSTNYVEKVKSFDDYQNSFKNVYTTVPTVSSHWGNFLKPTEFSTYKDHIRKPQHHEENDEVVHIPKKPPTDNIYGTQYESNSFNSDWAQNYKPQPNNYKLQFDWHKDNNRYKSEEDLLGLRNHDLRHSSHPPLRPSYDESAEVGQYKKLVDKWRQSYLKSKQKDTFREHETYASETKPIHVPVPKPYPIEIPHPVIVPVPQPYPIHVPVPKPVAVPVIRELTVPIEKPVPYPVYKKVPYPIEKPVPVPVEKQVHVPIMKPYPVTVPQVRPLFHHSRPHDERESDFDDEDEYQPRPESSKRVPNVKRPKNTRHQPRRPNRMTHQEREKKRSPARRPPPREQKRNRHPYPEHRRPPYRHHEDYDEYEPSEYVHCKRTGRC
ncbi:unnamed protein product [Colias eurytheme]|nr:unnamed protein product [Colias eurytheme]